MAGGPVRFVEVGGGWVGYRVIGGGADRALLWVPTGAGGNIDIVLEYPPMRRFFERLSAFADVILFDRRGTGVSDDIVGRDAPTLEDWSEDALAVLDAVGRDRTGILSHAMGTPPALLLAAAHPHRVESLVAINGFAYAGFRGPEQELYLASVAMGWGEGSAALMVNPQMRQSAEAREWLARSERNTFGRAAAVRTWRAWLANDARSAVPSVRARAVVLLRAGDPGAHVGRWLAAHLPDAELVEYQSPNFDFWLLDRQDEAVAAIERFLTGTAAAPPDDRVLATVLLTDIVDSTRTAVELGDRRWREILEWHDRVAGEVVGEHRGRLVKQTGDGVLAVFDGPARAVECACALRQVLGGEGVAVRSGLHTGEVELRGDDVSGVAVHIAARISGMAGPGEVLVSRTIPDLVAGSRLRFSSRGEHELRGVPGRWEVFELA